MSDTLPATKRCSRCQEGKPLEAFSRNRTRADGRNAYCRPCASAMNREYRPPQGPPPRACRECGATFQAAHPQTRFCSEACRRARQDADASRRRRAHYLANFERTREVKRRWNEAHPEAVRRHRWNHYHRDPARGKAKHAAWVAKNQERLRAYNRDYYRQCEAISQGKAAHPDGFLLIRHTYKGEAYYRAGLRGRRLGGNETAVAVYECMDERWYVLSVPLASERQKAEAEKLARRERFGHARAQRPIYRTVTFRKVAA